VKVVKPDQLPTSNSQIPGHRVSRGWELGLVISAVVVLVDMAILEPLTKRPVVSSLDLIALGVGHRELEVFWQPCRDT
jgi:hypothetical protein